MMVKRSYTLAHTNTILSTTQYFKESDTHEYGILSTNKPRKTSSACLEYGRVSRYTPARLEDGNCCETIKQIFI
jgi:hypothetical protein